MARSAPKKRKGAYHRTMVWLGWRKDETGNVIPNVPNAVKSGLKRTKAQAPKTKTYDDDFGAA